MLFGKVQPGVRSPDWYMTMLSDVHHLSTRTQTYTMAGAGAEAAVNGSVNVLARDQLPVTLDVSVMFHLNGTRAIDVFRSFGANYDDQIVHPLVRTAVRDAASEFAAVDLIDQRAALQARMTALVRQTLAATLRGRSVDPDAVQIDNILIRNIDLPQSIDEAIANVQRQRQATAASTQANLTAQQEACLSGYHPRQKVGECRQTCACRRGASKSSGCRVTGASHLGGAPDGRSLAAGAANVSGRGHARTPDAARRISDAPLATKLTYRPWARTTSVIGKSLLSTYLTSGS